MKRTYLAHILCIALLGISGVAQAQVTVEYGALGDNMRDTGGALAPAGDAVLLGTFPTGFNFSANQTFASLSANFTQFDSTSIGVGGTGSGQFVKDVVLNNPAFNNAQMYIWVFNTSVPSSATGWAIITNPAWTVPPTAGDFTAIDASDNGTFVPSGAFGVGVPSSIINPGGNGLDWKMTTSAAIPEPSTVSLLGFGGLAVVGLLRRIKK